MEASRSSSLPVLSLHGVVRALLLGVCIFFASRGVWYGLRPEGSDFAIFWNAGRAVLEGRDPASVDRYLYLPCFAVAIAPLALLPFAAALTLWQFASLAALAWSTRVCFRMVEREGLGRSAWLAWAPLLIALRFVDSNLAYGQVNLLTFALCTASIDAWLRARELRAGTLLGSAAALKIVPAALGIVFAARHSMRALAALVVAALLWVWVLPAPVLGWGANVDGLQRWWQAQVEPYRIGGAALLERREYVPGQSLTATAYRLLAPTPATSQGADGPQANVLDLELRDVHSIVIALELAWAGIACGLLWVSVRRAAPGARLRESSLAICMALTLAPLVHKAQMCWLILPYTVLLCGAPPGAPAWMRNVRVALIALSVLLAGASTPALVGRDVTARLLMHNSVFLGLQCAAAALALDVLAARRAVTDR